MLRFGPTLGISLALLASLASSRPAWTAPASISEYVLSSEGRAALDAATFNAPMRKGRVTLLHLGKRSMPAREKLIREAKSHIFISSPYWFGDETGKEMLEVMESAKAGNPFLDLRLFGDWLTPLQSMDYFSQGIFKRLRRVTDGQVALWNRLQAQRTWSFNIFRGRVHDKLLIADGNKLLMGGMNMGNTYLHGGLTREGWHDTDILIEGEMAQDAQRIFMKNYDLANFLNGPGNFPADRKEQIRVLQEIYYGGKSEVEYSAFDPTAPGVGMRRFRLTLSLPAFEKDAAYFPKIAPSSEDTAWMQLIFDHPLADRDPKTGKTFSKTRKVLELLFARAQERVRIFLPYLTITPEFERELVALAKRGVSVEIITNSMESHDLMTGAYYGSFSHYPALVHGGVKIYEWAGHPQLKRLEQENGCTIPVGHWPGSTLHTKMVIVDGQVVTIGSHNMNVRSETYNTESTALVVDSRLAEEAEAIFEYDLDVDASTRLVPCDGRMIERPRLVREVDREHVDAFYRANEKKIKRAAKRQWLM